MKISKPIAEVLLQEWNWSRNKIQPEEISRGSGVVVWWKCKEGHEWKAKVYSRTHGRNCPYCSGRKVNEENCLFALLPNIAGGWDYEKNFPLTPKQVTAGSKKKVWWKCEYGHQWECVICDRKKTGCPYCSGKRASEERNFEVCFPEIAKDSDKDKNGACQPSQFSPNSNRKFWWKCRKLHSWKATIASRSRGRGCPHCHSQSSNIEFRILSELLYIFPDASHRVKIDNLEVDIFIPEIKTGIEIDGYPWHKGKSSRDIKKEEKLHRNGVLLVRVRDERLGAITSTDILYSERRVDIFLLKQIINLIRMNGSFNDRHKKFATKYSKLDNFANEELYRTFVAGKVFASPDASLRSIFPQKAELWDQKKNGKLRPDDIVAYSRIKVWWRCEKGHEWEDWIYRVSSLSEPCPECAKLKFIKELSLKEKSADLLKEWDYEKNVSLSPEEVSNSSTKKVWWKCRFGHSWQAQISNRTRGTGCPYCNNKKVDGNNSLYRLRSELMKEWDYENNFELDPRQISVNSHKKVWWVCSQGHSWKADIANRSGGSGCPECWKNRRNVVLKEARNRRSRKPVAIVSMKK